MSNSGSELPTQYEHAKAQATWYQFWEEHGYFHAEPTPGKPKFSIVIPPPNVTGALHLGHALNNTLQDIVVRRKRMQGFTTMWMPGTDHAGIATQAVVERRMLEEEGKTRHDVGREALVERIWKWKDEYEQRILSQLKQLGASCDWQRTRFTFDATCARAVRHTFFSLFKEQLIYRGKKLVNWDTFLQTAVSDDELFPETVAGHFWHFRYRVIDPAPGEPTHVEIATTRPETMLGDTAVAVHPDPTAALDKVTRELETTLAEAPEKERADIESQIEELAVRRERMLAGLEQLRDMARDRRHLMLPLLERPIPLVCDEWAKPELGTGCVKITPAHDPNDYEVGKRQGLPMINILNPDGTLNAAAGKYEGLTIKQSRKQVVADLKAANLLGEIEDRQIDIKHSDRSKTIIEPYLADQWFVKMEMLAQTAMDAVGDGRVKIVPSRYAKGYLDWLSEKRDWPVSRQLWWGHRIPIWTRIVADESELADLQAHLDADPALEQGKLAYYVERPREDDSLSEEERAGLPLAVIQICIQEENAETESRVEKLGFEQDPDVLDTWFSSALWTHSTLGWPEQTADLDYFYPTDLLSTSRDIITLWVARMVLAGLHNLGEVPFREVFIHPKILDGYGETMSKSKGNGIDPIDVQEKVGADSLRFGLAYLTTETQDVRMPAEFECPNCDKMIAQTKKNRMLPKIACPECNAEFSTQWAREADDLALPRGAVVSERFELGRNFCNKLWNAARFVLINLDGYTPAAVSDNDLQLEDRWILSRLATVTQSVDAALDAYRFAEAARLLYDFAWDEFCSFYVEMMKQRLADESGRAVAQRVLAHALDQLLRLLHPFIPFITEDLWQRLATIAPQRGLARPTPAAEAIIIAPWPQAEVSRFDAEIEQRFAKFQTTLGGIREIRSRQNVAPKQTIDFSVRCDKATTELLQPMEAYFESMANAHATAWGPSVEPPELSANVSLAGIELFVDLADLIDVDAEIERNEKELTRLTGFITGKEKQLSNEKFTRKAPAAVVAEHRQSLEDAKQQAASIKSTLANLKARHTS